MEEWKGTFIGGWGFWFDWEGGKGFKALERILRRVFGDYYLDPVPPLPLHRFCRFGAWHS